MFVRTFACVLASFWLTGLAAAQPRDGEDRGFALRGGLGFTANPGAFLTAFEIPYFFNADWTLGPLVQIGVEDRQTLVAATLNARYFPDFGQRDSTNDFVRRLAPFAHAGVGLLHIDLDVPGDVDDTGFLFNVGFGVDFPITERVSIGSQLSFNVSPDGTLGENFFFSWQLMTAEFRF